MQPFLGSGGTYAGMQAFPKAVQTQLDQLIQHGVAITDQQACTKIYGQLQNLSYENALDIWLDQQQGRHYEQLWVKGYYYQPNYEGNFYFHVLSK